MWQELNHPEWELNMCVCVLETIVPSQQALEVTKYSPYAEGVVFFVLLSLVDTVTVPSRQKNEGGGQSFQHLKCDVYIFLRAFLGCVSKSSDQFTIIVQKPLWEEVRLDDVWLDMAECCLHPALTSTVISP